MAASSLRALASSPRTIIAARSTGEGALMMRFLLAGTLVPKVRVSVRRSAHDMVGSPAFLLRTPDVRRAWWRSPPPSGLLVDAPGVHQEAEWTAIAVDAELLGRSDR